MVTGEFGLTGKIELSGLLQDGYWKVGSTPYYNFYRAGLKMNIGIVLLPSQ